MIRYRDTDDYLTREQKIAIIADATLPRVDRAEIAPNEAGDWTGQRNDSFAGIDKAVKRLQETSSIVMGFFRDPDLAYIGA